MNLAKLSLLFNYAWLFFLANSVTPGPYLQALTVTPTMLLSTIDSEESELPRLCTGTKITKGVVLELYQFMNMHSECTFDTLRKWLFLMIQPKDNFPSVQAIRQSIIRLATQLTILRKQCNSCKKNMSIKSYLDEEYLLPTQFSCCHKLLKSSSTCSSLSPSYDFEKETLKAVNKDLCKELAETITK